MLRWAARRRAGGRPRNARPARRPSLTWVALGASLKPDVHRSFRPHGAPVLDHARSPLPLHERGPSRGPRPSSLRDRGRRRLRPAHRRGGNGKTTLCRCLLEQLPARVDVAFILNPKLTTSSFWPPSATSCACRVSGPAPSRKVYVDALHHHLLDAHGRGHRTVLIIDEAQDLAPDVLEQIRLLTNLETDHARSCCRSS